MGDGGAGVPVGGGQARGGAPRAATGQPHGAARLLQRAHPLRRGDPCAGARPLGPAVHVGRPPPHQGRARQPAGAAGLIWRHALTWHARLIWRRPPSPDLAPRCTCFSGYLVHDRCMGHPCLAHRWGRGFNCLRLSGRKGWGLSKGVGINWGMGCEIGIVLDVKEVTQHKE